MNLEEAFLTPMGLYFFLLLKMFTISWIRRKDQALLSGLKVLRYSSGDMFIRKPLDGIAQ